MTVKRAIGVFSFLAFLLAWALVSHAYQTYKVKKGDTLSGISSKFHVDIKKIKKDNHLSSNTIKPGTRLKIATKSSKKKTEKIKKTDPVKVNARKNTAAKTETLYHKVRKGENLSTIAKKYHLSLKELKDLNGINTKKEARIKTGRRLIVGKKSIKEEVTISAKAAQTPPQGEDEYHVVKKGESLGKIAKKHSITLAELKELNGIGKKSKIMPGQKLLVKKAAPVPEADTYVVRKGDTLFGVAKKFGLTPEELKGLNGLADEKLKTGQELLVKKEEAEEAPDVLLADSSAAPGPSLPEQSYSIQQEKLDNNLHTLVEEQTYEGMSTKEKLIAFAKTMLDIPYKFGGTGLYGIDCSAFVQKVFTTLGVSLPRTAREQFHKGVTVSLDELSIGDLVFFRTYASFPSHVGIYLGENLFIHASSLKKKVAIDKLDTPFYTKRFIAAKRLLSEEGLPSKDKAPGL